MELGTRGAIGELARGISYGVLLFGTVMVVLIWLVCCSVPRTCTPAGCGCRLEYMPGGTSPKAAFSVRASPVGRHTDCS